MTLWLLSSFNGASRPKSIQFHMPRLSITIVFNIYCTSILYRKSTFRTFQFENTQRIIQQYQMNILYRAFQMYIKYVFKVYYRQVEVIDKEIIPQQGPVLLIGNHNNLYLDGSMFINILNRSVSNIVAASSWKNNLLLDVGLKMTGSIPISRAWDKIQSGKGYITSVSKGLVTGKATRFSDFKGGDTLQLKNGQELRIASVETDELMRVKQEDYEYHEEGPFRIIPRLDNSNTFEVVWSALNEDRCISIFPEGYSQDRLELLPFKNGFCVAAFGALEKYGKKVTIVPCGMTYEDQSQFRSKITVEVGQPITIDEPLAELYRTNRPLALKTLLLATVKEEEGLVFDFRHYDRFEELKLIHAVFVEKHKDAMPAKERMAELRRITRYYSDRLREGNSQLDANAKELLQLGKMTGLQPKFEQETIKGALLSSFMVALTTLLMLPGYLLYHPPMLFILPKVDDYILQCVRKTKNRLKGYDATASATIMYCSVIFPITTAITFAVIYLLISYLRWTSHAALLCMIGYALQPVYLLLFVKLWDLQHKYNQKLRFYVGHMSKKSLVLRFSSLCEQIIAEISNASSHQQKQKTIPSLEDSKVSFITCQK